MNLQVVSHPTFVQNVGQRMVKDVKKTVALPHLSNRFIFHETLVLQLFQYFNVF